MAGLQPHPTGAPCAPIDVAIDLDASEPFLDDHRPGGDPLLGTAMGVELMSRAAHRMATGATDRQRTTEHVGVFEPLILRSKSATVHVRAVRLGDDAHAPIHCVVESRCRGGLPVPHFEASFVHAEPCIADTRLPAGVQLGAQPAVNDADVYSLFFHGPAFRVIHSASSVGDGMLCEWRQDLPAWARGPVDPATADPRWVELCLQTAGLLEIATTQRMLIPHRIGSIEHIAV